MIEQICHRYHKARKRYVCDYCCAHIEPGELYSYSFIANSGDHYAFRSHTDCEFIANELAEFIDPWDGMTCDDFIQGCRDFCDYFICPKCPFLDEYHECSKDSDFCPHQIANILEKYTVERMRKGEPDFYKAGGWKLVERIGESRRNDAYQRKDS